uniref:Uncharacterized protein n=1 Tax=Arundo donax TaxID=35708 RepID=A0A0A8ZL06_ARUDO
MWLYLSFFLTGTLRRSWRCLPKLVSSSCITLHVQHL